jgi:hypothetical protein
MRSASETRSTERKLGVVDGLGVQPEAQQNPRGVNAGEHGLQATRGTSLHVFSR